MITAANISRAVRDPKFKASQGTETPPVFMTLPTTLARRAVREYHEKGAEAAINYVASSKLGEWAHHEHPSMATNAQNTINGVIEYTRAAAADGRVAKATNRRTVVTLPSGVVDVTIDVVLDDGRDLAGRVIMWDGPDVVPGDAPLIAAVYSEGLQQLYPGCNVTTIGVWQGRRQTRVEVPFPDAQAELGRADQILSGLS